MEKKAKAKNDKKTRTKRSEKPIAEQSVRVMFFDMFKGKIIESADCWD